MTHDPFKPVPNDILNEILRYLSAEEMTAFKMAAKGMAARVSLPRFDALLQPYLNRLRQLDDGISAVAPQGVDPKSAWRFNQFKEGFKRIQKAQIADIHAILNYQKIAQEVSFPADLLERVEKAKIPSKKLEDLEQRQRVLDELNICVINRRLNPQHAHLNLTSTGITSIPSALITEDRLQHFWQNLQRIECDNNYLRSLPEELYALPQLIQLRCGDNFLHLPQAYKDKFGEFAYDEMTCRQFTGLSRIDEDDAKDQSPTNTPTPRP